MKFSKLHTLKLYNLRLDITVLDTCAYVYSSIYLPTLQPSPQSRS
jgi:hypothetical protein